MQLFVCIVQENRKVLLIWSGLHRQLYIMFFFGALPAIRCNLLRRTMAQKDFHCTRAKRTGEAIGAAEEPIFLSWSDAHWDLNTVFMAAKICMRHNFCL